MAAPKPKPAADDSPPPSALAAVFRRLARAETVPAAAAPRFEGFAEARAPDRAAARPADPPKPADRRNLRGRVRGWLSEAPPTFEAVPPAEPRPAPPSPPVRPLGAPAGNGTTFDRAAHPGRSRNRRVYRRVELPAEIEIGGTACTLIDISVGGFAATDAPPLAATDAPPLAAGSAVRVAIRLTIDGIDVGTEVDARIIYATQGRSSGRFVDLTPSQMAFLRYLITWRGESVGAVGTTTLLDAIAGGPSRPSGSNADELPPRERRWPGWIGRKS
jgi:PilZ domain-containing protein